jgi:hypothetical protein
MLTGTLLHYGGKDALPRPLTLQAGPLTMIFEPASGFLRHLRLGDHEVLRGIYGAVRDHNWATIPPQVANLESEIGKDSFRLTFDVTCRQGAVDYFWRGAVSGEANGQVTYSFDGEARSRFLRNRIGLCVLHPIAECAGQPCAVEHVDGTVEPAAFARAVTPPPIFTDLRALTHEVATTGIRAEVRFTGDVFETEDQREYTDESFKTYSTPQRLPKPAPVEPGAQAQQSVTLRLHGNVRPILPVVQGRPPQFSIATTPVFPLPPLGLCVASHGQPLSPREVERLRRLGLSHLRVDLRLASAAFADALRRAAAEAGQLGVGLHAALFVTDNAEQELAALAGEVERLKPRVALWLVLHETEECTGEKWVRLALQSLPRVAPGALVASGTRDWFANLNAARPPREATWFPCYAASPQVHLPDNLTMVENLAGLASTVETAKEFSPRPVVISPITLRPRSHPADPRERAVTDADPRQMSLFAAGWTLGSLARLAATGHAHSLTYFETTGALGVMATEDAALLPPDFPAPAGGVFPVYHVLADIGEFPGKQVYPTHSSHPLLAEGLTLFDAAGRRRILVANLSADAQEVKVKTGTCVARVRYLDETNAGQALREPETFRALAGEPKESVAGKIELKLLPFAVARVDIGQP